MCAWQKSKTKPWLRFAAFCTALVFTSTSILWADGSGPAASSLFAEKKLETLPSIPSPTSAEFLKEIVLPASMGQIKEQYQGTNGKVILHIQDAHINEDAQRNIAAILKYFSNTQGLDFIGLEGAEGKIYPGAVSFFPDKKAVTQMADYFLKNGKISGPLYYGITESPKIEFFGIEQEGLYEKNRQAYLDALNVQARDEEILRELKKSLNDVSRYILSPELKEMTTRREEFQKNTSQLIPYIRFLEGQAEKQKVSLQDYPRVQSLIALMKIEGGVNFENAEQEVNALIQKMKSMVTRDRLTAFLTSTVQYETKRLGRDRYFKILEDEAAQIESRSPGFKKAHENAFKYVQYMRLYESISVDVFSEVDNLEKRLKENLFRDDREKRFDHLLTVANIFEKMFAFELTKDDVDFFYQNRDDFNAETFRSFIEPLFEEFHFEKHLPEQMSVLDKDLQIIERFYSAALERDQVLIGNAARRLEERESHVAAVVTGGFHTPGLELYLREHGYSYLVITPRITNQIDEAAEGKLYEESLKETPAELAVMLQKALVAPRSSSSLNDPRFQLSARLPFTEGSLASFVSAVGDGNPDSPFYYQTVIANEPVTGSSLFLGAAISTLASTQTPAEINTQIIAGLENSGLPADYMKAATVFVSPFASAVRSKGGDSQNAVIAVPIGDSQVLVGTYVNSSRSEVRGAVSGQRFLEVPLGRETTFAAGVGDSALKPGTINLVRSEKRQVAATPSKQAAPAPKVSPATASYKEVSAAYINAAKSVLVDSNPLTQKKSDLINLFKRLQNDFKLSAEKTPALLNPKGNAATSFVALHQQTLLIVELNDFAKRFKDVSDVLRAGKLSIGDVRRVQEDGRKVLTDLESFKSARGLDLKRLGLDQQVSNIEKFHNEIESRAGVSRRTAWFFSALQFLKNLWNRFLGMFKAQAAKKEVEPVKAPVVSAVSTNPKVIAAYRAKRLELFKPTGTGKGFTAKSLDQKIKELEAFAKQLLKENYPQGKIPAGLIDPQGGVSSSVVALHRETQRKINMINFRHRYNQMLKAIKAAQGNSDIIAKFRADLNALNSRYGTVKKIYQPDFDRMGLRGISDEISKLAQDLETRIQNAEKSLNQRRAAVTTPASRASRTPSRRAQIGVEQLDARINPSSGVGSSDLALDPLSGMHATEYASDYAYPLGVVPPHVVTSLVQESSDEMDLGTPTGFIDIQSTAVSGNIELNFQAQDRNGQREYYFAVGNSNQSPLPASFRQGTLTSTETHGVNLHVFEFRQDPAEVRPDAILIVDTADSSGLTRLYVFEGNRSTTPALTQLPDGRIQVSGVQGTRNFEVRQQAAMPDAAVAQALNWASVAPMDLASAAIAGFSNSSNDDIAAMFPTTSNLNPTAIGAFFGMVGNDAAVATEPVGAIIKAETMVGGVRVQLKEYPENLFKVAVIQNGNEYERELPKNGGVYSGELSVEVQSEDGRRWLKITVRNQQGEKITTNFDLDENSTSRFFEIERVPDVKGNRATIGGPGPQGLTGISGGGGGPGFAAYSGAGGGGASEGPSSSGGLSGGGISGGGESHFEIEGFDRGPVQVAEVLATARLGTTQFEFVRTGDTFSFRRGEILEGQNPEDIEYSQMQIFNEGFTAIQIARGILNDEVRRLRGTQNDYLEFTGQTVTGENIYLWLLSREGDGPVLIASIGARPSLSGGTIVVKLPDGAQSNLSIAGLRVNPPNIADEVLPPVDEIRVLPAVPPGDANQQIPPAMPQPENIPQQVLDQVFEAAGRPGISDEEMAILATATTPAPRNASASAATMAFALGAVFATGSYLVTSKEEKREELPKLRRSELRADLSRRAFIAATAGGAATVALGLQTGNARAQQPAAQAQPSTPQQNLQVLRQKLADAKARHENQQTTLARNDQNNLQQDDWAEAPVTVADQEELVNSAVTAQETVIPADRVTHAPVPPPGNLSAAQRQQMRERIESIFSQQGLGVSLEGDATFNANDWQENFFQHLFNIFAITDFNRQMMFLERFQDNSVYLLEQLRGMSIARDAEVRRFWRGDFTGMVNTNEWVMLNQAWSPQKRLQNVDLGTLMGMSITFSMIDLARTFGPRENSANTFAGDPWSRRMLLEEFTTSLNREGIVGANRVRYYRFTEMFMRQYANIFFHQLRPEDRDNILEKGGHIFAGIIRRSGIYPHLNLPPGDIIGRRGLGMTAFLPTIAAMMRTGLWPRGATMQTVVEMPVNQQTGRINAGILRAPFERLAAVMSVMRAKVEEVYQGRDPRLMEEVFQQWLSGAYRAGSGRARLVSAGEIANMDYGQLPADAVLLRAQAQVDQSPEMTALMTTQVAVETAVSLKFGKLIYWTMYALQNDLIQVGEVPATGPAPVRSPGITQLMNDMRGLLPLTEALFNGSRKKFNLNDDQDMGVLVGIARNMRKSRMPMRHFKIFLQLGMDSGLVDETLRVNRAATRNQIWTPGRFNIRKSYAIGALLGWIQNRVISGLHASRDQAQELETELNVDAHRNQYLGWALRLKKIWTPERVPGEINQARITQLATELSTQEPQEGETIMGFLLGEASGFMRADMGWEAWGRLRGDTLALIEGHRDAVAQDAFYVRYALQNQGRFANPDARMNLLRPELLNPALTQFRNGISQNASGQSWIIGWAQSLVQRGVNVQDLENRPAQAGQAERKSVGRKMAEVILNQGLPAVIGKVNEFNQVFYRALGAPNRHANIPVTNQNFFRLAAERQGSVLGFVLDAAQYQGGWAAWETNQRAINQYLATAPEADLERDIRAALDRDFIVTQDPRTNPALVPGNGPRKFRDSILNNALQRRIFIASLPGLVRSEVRQETKVTRRRALQAGLAGTAAVVVSGTLPGQAKAQAPAGGQGQQGAVQGGADWMGDLPGVNVAAAQAPQPLPLPPAPQVGNPPVFVDFQNRVNLNRAQRDALNDIIRDPAKRRAIAREAFILDQVIRTGNRDLTDEQFDILMQQLAGRNPTVQGLFFGWAEARMVMGWDNTEGLVDRLAAVLSDQGKRNDIVSEVDLLLQLRRPNAEAVGGNLSNAMEKGMIISWAQFRISQSGDLEQSWRETRGVAAKVARILNAEIGVDRNTASPYLSTVAKLYALSQGQTAAQIGAIPAQVRITDFLADDEKWKFLMGFTISNAVDLTDPLLKPRAGAPVLTDNEILQKHSASLLFMMMNMRDPLQLYYQRLGIPEQLNPAVADASAKRTVWGKFSSRLRMIEELLGTFDLTEADLRQVIQRLNDVQQAAITHWTAQTGENVSDQLIYYLYGLFYGVEVRKDLSGVEGLELEPGQQEMRPYSDMMTIEHFFRLMALSQRSRISATDGDPNIQSTRDGIFNMRNGILPALQNFKNNPSTRPFWMTESDVDELILHISGDPARGIEGLRNEHITPGEAIQGVTFFLDHLQNQWPGIESAEEELLRITRLERFLQAVYMLHHRNEDGHPMRLDLADLSSWITLIRKGRFTAEEVAGFIRDDGAFESMERRMRRKMVEDRAWRNRLAANLGFTISDEDAARIARNVPLFDASGRLGFVTRLGHVVRMHNKYRAMSRLMIPQNWIESWFEDMFAIQTASFLKNNKLFIDPANLSYVVDRFREGVNELGTPQFWRLVSFFEGTGTEDISFQDLGEPANKLRRFLGTWTSVFHRMPTDEEIRTGLGAWDTLAERLRARNVSAPKVEAMQRELISRFHGMHSTLENTLLSQLYEIAPDDPLSENFSPIQTLVKEMMNEHLISLQVNLDEREQQKRELRERKRGEVAVLEPMRNQLARTRNARRGELPAGRTEKAITDSLRERYRAFRLLNMDMNLPEDLSRGEYQFFIEQIKAVGYSEDEIFLRYIDLEVRAMRMYRRVHGMNGPDRVSAKQQKYFVSALAERIFTDWGFTVQEQRNAIAASSLNKTVEQGITEELARTQRVLADSVRIRNKMQQFGVLVSHEKAYQMADNSSNSAVTVAQIENWIDLSQRIYNFINSRQVKGQNLRVSKQQILYLVDLWLKIGLSAVPQDPAIPGEEVYRQVVTRELGKLSPGLANDQRRVNALIAQMRARRVLPAQIKRLVDEARAIQERIAAAKAENEAMDASSDRNRSPQGDFDFNNIRMSPVDALALADLGSPVSDALDLVDLPEFQMRRAVFEEMTIRPANASIRYFLRKELLRRVNEEIWQRPWGWLEKKRYELWTQYGIGNMHLLGYGQAAIAAGALFIMGRKALRHNFRNQEDPRLQITGRFFLFSWLNFSLAAGMVLINLLSYNYSLSSASAILFSGGATFYLFLVVPLIYILATGFYFGVRVAYNLSAAIINTGKMRVWPSLLEPYNLITQDRMDSSKASPAQAATGTLNAKIDPQGLGKSLRDGKLPSALRTMVSVATPLQPDATRFNPANGQADVKKWGYLNNVNEVFGNPDLDPSDPKYKGAAWNMIEDSNYDPNLYFGVVLQIFPKDMTISEEEFNARLNNAIDFVQHRLNRLPENVRKRVYVWIRPAKLTKPFTHYNLQNWMVKGEGDYNQIDPRYNPDPDYTAEGSPRYMRRVDVPVDPATGKPMLSDRMIPFKSAESTDPDVFDARFPGGVMGGDINDPNDMRAIRERNIQSAADAKDRTNEIFALKVYDPGNNITFRSLLDMLATAADPRNPEVVYIPSMEYDSAFATPESMIMNWFAQRMLSFTWFVQSWKNASLFVKAESHESNFYLYVIKTFFRFLRNLVATAFTGGPTRIRQDRPPGKYLLLLNDKTVLQKNQDGTEQSVTVDSFYKRVVLTNRYQKRWAFSYQKGRASDELVTIKGEDYHMSVAADGGLLVSEVSGRRVVVTEDPMFNFPQKIGRLMGRWRLVFDQPEVVVMWVVPEIRNHPYSFAGRIGFGLTLLILGVLNIQTWAVALSILAIGTVVTAVFLGTYFLSLGREMAARGAPLGQLNEELSPGHEAEAQMMRRGLFSDPVFLALLIIQMKNMIVQNGVQVLFPQLGLISFIGLMALFLLPKFLPAIRSFANAWLSLLGSGNYSQTHSRVGGFFQGLGDSVLDTIWGVVEAVASPSIFLTLVVILSWSLFLQFPKVLHLVYFNVFGKHPPLVTWAYRNIYKIPATDPIYTKSPSLLWVAANVGEGNPLFSTHLKIFRSPFTVFILSLWLMAPTVVPAAAIFISAPILVGLVYLLTWKANKNTKGIRGWLFNNRAFIVGTIVLYFGAGVLGPAFLSKDVIWLASTIVIGSFGFASGWSWLMGLGVQKHGTYIESGAVKWGVTLAGAIMIAVGIAATFYPLDFLSNTVVPLVASVAGLDGQTNVYMFSIQHQVRLPLPFVWFFTMIFTNQILFGVIGMVSGMVHEILTRFGRGTLSLAKYISFSKSKTDSGQTPGRSEVRVNRRQALLMLGGLTAVAATSIYFVTKSGKDENLVPLAAREQLRNAQAQYFVPGKGLLSVRYIDNEGRTQNVLLPADWTDARGNAFTGPGRGDARYTQPLTMAFLAHLLARQASGEIAAYVPNPLNELEKLINFFDYMQSRYDAPVWLRLGTGTPVLDQRNIGIEDFDQYIAQLAVTAGVLIQKRDSLPADSAERGQIQRMIAGIRKIIEANKGTFEKLYQPARGLMAGDYQINQGQIPGQRLTPIRNRYKDRRTVEDRSALALIIALYSNREDLSDRLPAWTNAQFRLTPAGHVQSWTGGFDQYSFNQLTGIENARPEWQERYQRVVALYLQKMVESGGRIIFPGPHFSGDQYLSNNGLRELAEHRDIVESSIVPGYLLMAAQNDDAALQALQGLGDDARNPQMGGLLFDSIQVNANGQKVPTRRHSALLSGAGALALVDSASAMTAFLNDSSAHGVEGLSRRLDLLYSPANMQAANRRSEARMTTEQIERMTQAEAEQAVEQGIIDYFAALLGRADDKRVAKFKEFLSIQDNDSSFRVGDVFDAFKDLMHSGVSVDINDYLPEKLLLKVQEGALSSEILNAHKLRQFKTPDEAVLIAGSVWKVPPVDTRNPTNADYGTYHFHHQMIRDAYKRFADGAYQEVMQRFEDSPSSTSVMSDLEEIHDLLKVGGPKDESLKPRQRMLLELAMAFHDIGRFVSTGPRHPEIGGRIVEQILKRLGGSLKEDEKQLMIDLTSKELDLGALHFGESTPVSLADTSDLFKLYMPLIFLFDVASVPRFNGKNRDNYMGRLTLTHLANFKAMMSDPQDAVNKLTGEWYMKRLESFYMPGQKIMDLSKPFNGNAELPAAVVSFAQQHKDFLTNFSFQRVVMGVRRFETGNKLKFFTLAASLFEDSANAIDGQKISFLGFSHDRKDGTDKFEAILNTLPAEGISLKVNAAQNEILVQNPSGEVVGKANFAKTVRGIEINMDSWETVARSEARQLFADNANVQALIQQVREQWEEIQRDGAFVFDVEKTIADFMSPLPPQSVELLRDLLRAGVRVAIITGMPEEPLLDYVLAPLKTALTDDAGKIQSLTLYSNGGATKSNVSAEGLLVPDDAYNQARVVSDRFLPVVQNVLNEMAREKFGLGDRAKEVTDAWKAWISQRFPNLTFDFSWADDTGAQTWTAPIIDSVDFWTRSRQGGAPISLPAVVPAGHTGEGAKRGFGIINILHLPQMPEEVRLRVEERILKAVETLDPEHKIRTYSGGVSAIDVIGLETNKATALLDYVNAEKIRKDRTYYFGDQFYAKEEATVDGQSRLIEGNDESVATSPELQGVVTLGVNSAAPENSKVTQHIGTGVAATVDFIREAMPQAQRSEVRRDDRDIQAKDREAAIELQLQQAESDRARALSEAVRAADVMRQEITLGQILKSIKNISGYETEMTAIINAPGTTIDVKAIVIDYNEAEGRDLNFVLDVLARLPEEAKLSVIANADQIEMLKANADVNAAIGAGQMFLKGDLVKEVDLLKLRLEVTDNQAIGQTFVDGPVTDDDMSVIRWAHIRAAQLTDKTILILGGANIPSVAQIKISEILRGIEAEIRSELRVKASA